ncbi:MAG: transglutaminase domain-containing protein [Ectothiorhodospiraceae bacterium]|nr:transglutaminase domain-containing protein [Ectothiorhodospiraceae bacterium]
MKTQSNYSGDGIDIYLFKRRFVVVVASILLIPFCWLATGADVWAKAVTAQDDPAQFMQNMAVYNKINVSRSPQSVSGGSKYSARSALSRQIPSVKHPTHSERQAVRLQQEVVGELMQLRSSKKLSKNNLSTKLSAINEKLSDSHQKILKGFVATEKLLVESRIDKAIIERQKTHHLRYVENWDILQKKIKEAELSPNLEKRNNALDSAVEFLNTSHDQRPQQPINVKNLPFAVSKPVQRKPRSNWGAGLDETIVPADDFIKSILDFIIEPATAALAPVNAADFLGTEDVQITPEVVALAASLGNQPVAIYDWVKNNIDFYASYGSVQGSQLTLEMKKGNATDTSSLLIALLRAAGIPARFVTGTVNIPVSGVISWLGNVPDANFAQQVLGSGGIPNVAIVDGFGNIISFDIEHTWVETYVDMIPSRSAIHVTGDTWVKMDASFKQYISTVGSNIIADVPITPVLTAIQDSLTVDESLGKLSSVDADVSAPAIEDWVNQIIDYAELNGINPTPAAMFGDEKIIQSINTAIPGTVPFTIKSNATPVADLPVSIRHKVLIKGYSSSFNRTLGSPDFSATVNLSSLGSKRLGLNFDPATAGDSAVLQAAIDASSTSLPISSVNVVPRLMIDDVIVNSGNIIGMGDDYFLDVTISGPDGAVTLPYDVVAGDIIVIGVTGNGFSPDVLQNRIDASPVNTSLEYLHQVNLHYWTETDFLNEQSANGMGGYIVRLPSVGLFSSPLTVTYVFGQPNTGVYASKVMDVKRSFIGAAATTPTEKILLVKQAGFNGSTMEGTTFDQFEATVTGTPQVKSIDAMKLLAAATTQGIPVYRITPSNQATVFPLLNLDASDESAISSALSQGQTVLAPQNNINIGPWSGAGYILQNETTGEGAYLISGGLNGGGLPDCLEELVGKVVPIVVAIVFVIFAAILIYLLAMAIAAIIAGVGVAAAGVWAAFLLMVTASSVMA